MMVFSAINDEVFDKAQVIIGYCKLFPHIMRDFLTRSDCQEMMKSTNLPVSTTVQTVLAGGTPTGGPVTGTGQGKGSGTTTPRYVGQVPLAGSELLAKQKEAQKDAGGAATSAALGALGNL